MNKEYLKKKKYINFQAICSKKSQVTLKNTNWN